MIVILIETQSNFNCVKMSFLSRCCIVELGNVFRHSDTKASAWVSKQKKLQEA